MSPVYGRLLAGLRGRVVEIGAGAGRSFAAYPPHVTDVLAVEPDPGRRALARAAAAAAPVPVAVVDGVAERLPLPAGSVDAVVCSLVRCTVGDVPGALAEVRRVLRPGGELRFYEHVIAPRGPVRALQRVAGLLWPLVADGCHIDRDSVASIAGAGFELQRSATSGTRLMPCVLGVART